MGRKLLLIGGGGHCHSVLDSVIDLGIFDEIGIVDYTDCAFGDVSVVGTDDDIPELVKKGWTDAFITVGSIGNTDCRRRLYDMVKNNGLNVPSIIDPTAVVSKFALLKDGIYVGKKAIINSGTKVGVCSIINSGAIIEHDCSIGDFVHVSPGCVICGQVKIGDDSHVGAGSVIRQQIEVKNNVLIGAGSVVVKDISEDVKAFGNPCKVVK